MPAAGNNNKRHVPKPECRKRTPPEGAHSGKRNARTTDRHEKTQNAGQTTHPRDKHRVGGPPGNTRRAQWTKTSRTSSASTTT